MMESSDSVTDESGPREWCPSLDTRDSPTDLPRYCIAGLRLLGDYYCYIEMDNRVIYDLVDDSGNSCRLHEV